MLVFTLAACGGTAAPEPAQSSAAASAAAKPSTSAAAKPATQVKIAIAGANIIESSAELANRDGNYAKHGVSATITRINGSTNTLAALQSGDIQLAMTTGEATLFGQAKGLPLFTVAAVNQGFTQSVVMSSKWVQAHPLPSNPTLAQRASLLNGATLGQLGAATDTITIKHFLQLANLPDNAVKSVKMQNQEGQLAALKQGQIDGITLSAPESFQAEAEGFGKVVLNSRDIPKWDEVPYIVTLTTKDYAKSNPQAVKDSLAAIEEALAKMAAGGPAVLDFVKTVYPTYSPDALQRSLDFVHLTPYQPQTAEMWSVEAQIANESGALTSPFTPKEGTDWSNDFMPAKPA